MRDDYISSNPKRLYRSRDKVIAGVCGGIAERMGWDPTITRVVAAICLFGGVGFIIPVVPGCLGHHALPALSPAQSDAGRRTLLDFSIGPAARNLLEHPLQVQGHGRPAGQDWNARSPPKMENSARNSAIWKASRLPRRSG